MQHKFPLTCISRVFNHISGLFTVDGCSVVMETIQLSSLFLSLYFKTISGTVMSFLYFFSLLLIALCEFVKIILLNFQLPSRHFPLKQTSKSKMAAALINSHKDCRIYYLLALQTNLCLMKLVLNKALSNFDPWTSMSILWNALSINRYR